MARPGCPSLTLEFLILCANIHHTGSHWKSIFVVLLSVISPPDNRSEHQVSWEESECWHLSAQVLFWESKCIYNPPFIRRVFELSTSKRAADLMAEGKIHFDSWRIRKPGFFCTCSWSKSVINKTAEPGRKLTHSFLVVFCVDVTADYWEVSHLEAFDSVQVIVWRLVCASRILWQKKDTNPRVYKSEVSRTLIRV